MQRKINTKQLSETNDLLISLVSLSYVLAHMEIIASISMLVCVVHKCCFCVIFSPLHVKMNPLSTNK